MRVGQRGAADAVTVGRPVEPLRAGLSHERFLEALRPGLMGPRLARAVGGPPRGCHVLDAKYEPGVRAVVLYEYAGHLIRGDLQPSWTQPAPGSCLVAPGVALHRFPDDPDLPQLPTLMAGLPLHTAQPAALGELSPCGAGRARSRNSLLRYRPGRRATVRVTVPGVPGGYVAKAYSDPAKAAAVANEAPALADLAGRCEVLRLAPMVAHFPEVGVVVQRGVPGIPLNLLVGPSRVSHPGVRQAVSRAGLALAELHAGPLVPSRQRSVVGELRRFRLRAERIRTVAPRLGSAAVALAERLNQSETRLPAARTGTVHGDCKPSQFLVGDAGTYLIDLDHVAVSDQAADVGTFLASLRQLGLRRSLAAREPAGGHRDLLRLADAFLASYLGSRGDQAELARIRWQEAVALERKALRAFARAPASPLPAALLAEASRCLDVLEGADQEQEEES